MVRSYRPYRRLKWSAAFLTVGAIVVAAVSRFGPGQHSELCWYAGLFVGIPSSILWIVWKVAGSRAQGLQTELSAKKQVLAQWSIEPDQWNRYVEEARGKKPMFVALIAVSCLGLLVLLAEFSSSETAQVTSFDVFAFLIFSVVWICMRAIAVPPWHRVREAVPVILGPDSGVVGGRVFFWNASGSTLIEATSEPGTCRIQFRSSVLEYPRSRIVVQYVPFPPGAREQVDETVSTINRLAGGAESPSSLATKDAHTIKPT